MPEIPRIIIGGTQSGVGKTSLTLGIVALLRRQGLRVQTFKVGPDYLDPTYLAMVSGRPCYNLDGWMTDQSYIKNLFLRAAADADIAVVEGVMGLFDGADPVSSDGSTAQIAEWLEAPVLLICSVHGMARSLAAEVHGYSTFDPHIHVGGVIANHCGSERHGRFLRDSVEKTSSVKMLGAVLRGSLPVLSSRHLGLVSARHATLASDMIDNLADSLTSALDIDGILTMARRASPWNEEILPMPSAARRCRLGIAYDDAFHFYYPDNLEALERAGCELVKFSPLKDTCLPESLHGLYLGGGYPEEHAEALSANVSMLEHIREFPGKIYAECGGLMYLSEGIETRSGARWPQVGLLPTWVRMRKQLKTLGYAEVTFSEPTLWGNPGNTLRGHEYHYSELLNPPDWKPAYVVKHRMAKEGFAEGFQHKNILASYVHLHFASHPEATLQFVEQVSAQ